MSHIEVGIVCDAIPGMETSLGESMLDTFTSSRIVITLDLPLGHSIGS